MGSTLTSKTKIGGYLNNCLFIVARHKWIYYKKEIATKFSAF